MRPLPLRLFGPLAVACLAAVTIAGENGVRAASGDKLGADLATGDTDDFDIDVSEGGSLTVKVTAAKGTNLVPDIRLFRPDGVEVDIAAFLKKDGTPKPQLKKYPPGPGETGTWTLRVDGVGSGAYTAQFAVATPTSSRTKKLVVPAGGTARVELTGADAALLTATIKTKSGAGLTGARVISPDGSELGGSAAAFTQKGKKLAAKKLALAGGFGRYVLELTGSPDGDTTVDVVAKLKLPKPAKRKVTLPPEGRLSGVSQNIVKQGDTALVVDIDGTGLLDGSVVTAGSDGVDVIDIELTSATRLRLTLDVAPDAPFGLRDVTVRPPPLLGEAFTFRDAFRVNAPDPSVSFFSPRTLRQGDTDIVVDLLGNGFRDGGAVRVSGDGVTVGTTTVNSDSSVRVLLSAAIDAATVSRTITWEQPVDGGGASADAFLGLLLENPVPVLDSISPDSLGRGETAIIVTLRGNHFRDGGSVEFGDGVTLEGASFIDETRFRVSATVDANAVLGTRDVTYTQPSSGGGADVTLDDGLLIKAPVPTITSISPSSMTRGQGPTTVTLTGADFEDGGTIAIDAIDITVGATEFVSSTTVRAPVTVNAGAAFGARDVSYTQPVALGGAVGIGGDFAVHALSPTLTDITPDELDQRASGSVTATGTNFTSSGTLGASGQGVSFTNLVLNSTTELTADYAIASDATIGLLDVTYTQSGAAGAGAATLDDSIEVIDTRVMLTSVTPSDWLIGSTRIDIGVVGEQFNAGTSASVSGGDVTVHRTTFVSPTALTLEVSVDETASPGGRNLTITPGAGGADPRTFTSAFDVVPADPTVTVFSHVTLGQGASSVDVTVNGTNFRSGDIVSASGTGVTFASTSVGSSTEITTKATLTAGATLGLRDLTVTRAASAGGRSASLDDAFSVVSGTPSITTAAPSAIGRTGSGGATREVPVRITGTGFMSGATLAVAKSGGSGLTLVSGSEEVLSGTLLTATLSITGTATTGLWDLTVTNPASLGNSGTSGNGKIDVKSESTLVVNSVSPSPGSTFGGDRVTVHGGDFTAGAVVDFGTLRATGVNVLDSHTLRATVPAPTTASRSQETRVNVKVTLSGGTNATLTDGYGYSADARTLRVLASFPARNSLDIDRNIVRNGLLLSDPVDPATAVYDGTAGTGPSSTGLRWFLFQSGAVSGGSIAFGPNSRWVVFKRTGGSLNATSGYVLSATSALKSTSGSALVPVFVAGDTIEQLAYFTHASNTDSTAPTLSTISPASAATGVALGAAVTLTFSEGVDPSTLTANVQLELGDGTVIPSGLDISEDWTIVALTPATALATSTAHTVRVKAGLIDASGNAITALTRTFTTGTGTDTTAPTIDGVVLDGLRSDMDGSGTYVSASGVNTAFDAYLGRSDWEVVVSFSDVGDAGIDTGSFSAKASVVVGTSAANGELAALFDVTPTQATWRVPSTFQFTAGDNVTFTFLIKDLASTPNTSTSKVITFDVVDKDTTASAGGGGDHDPFDTRQTWLLRGDLDVYTATFHESGGSRGITTTVSSNGIRDLQEAFELVGLNSSSMTSAAAATSNGTARGTNDIVYDLFTRAHRDYVRERYSIDADGTRDGDSPNVEFLIEGEQGSLTSLPTWSPTNSANSLKAYSEMTIGSTLRADTSQFGLTEQVIGTAWIDPRNRRQEANVNDGTSNATGVYAAHYFESQMQNAGSFRSLFADNFVTLFGGTPVGEHASDDDVLAGTFDRTTSVNATHNTRYDEIIDGIDFVALLISAVTAHEIGHSTGLVQSGAPKTGLFGGAHLNNTFSEATSSNPNTTSHLDVVGPSIMQPKTNVTTDSASGASFSRFNTMIRAYLLGRLVHDEGK